MTDKICAVQFRVGSPGRGLMAGPVVVVSVLALLLLSGCGGFRSEAPTRTPVPTFTLTPEGQGPAQPAADSSAVIADTPTPAAVVQIPTEAPTDTPAPPTSTPEPTATPEPTLTPMPTATPTETPVPTPTPTPDYRFELEMAEKFPTQGLAADVVRVYAYVYSDMEFALADYTLRVAQNGAQLDVDQQSSGGLPAQTRSEPSPYTRFYNLTTIFVGSQAGEWNIQLVDPDGNIVGPPAEFQLSAEENTRELYVRYRQR